MRGKSMKRIVTGMALGIAALAFAGGEALAAKCVRAGGSGIGIVKDLAAFMANAAANNAAKAWGGDGVKITKLKENCAFETLSYSCKVTVKACK